MINLDDIKDAERFAKYLTNRLKEPIDINEVQNSVILSGYLNRNSPRGSINTEDVKDLNKLANFVNRIT